MDVERRRLKRASLSGHHALLVILGQQEHLVVRPADDQIEVVEDVSPQNAHVGGVRIGKGKVLPTYAHRNAVALVELKSSGHRHVSAHPTDTGQSQSRLGGDDRESEPFYQSGTKDCTVRPAVQQKDLLL